MTPQDRKDSYLQQFNVQFLKIVHAYGKMLSYHSKLTKPELAEQMTPEDYEKFDDVMTKSKELFHSMDGFTHSKW